MINHTIHQLLTHIPGIILVFIPVIRAHDHWRPSPPCSCSQREYLAQETSRANEAERQFSEILVHFKITHHAMKRLEIDLQSQQQIGMGLYKTQLEIGLVGTLAAIIMKAIWFI